MTEQLAQTYPTHMATMIQRADAALEKGGHEHLLVAAGKLQYRFEDDNPYPFAVNPQFKAWLPVTQAPGSWLSYTPGKKPKLIYLQPRDYWHVVPEAPDGYWTEHFEIEIVHTPDQVRQHLPRDPDSCAIIGPADSIIEDIAPNRPQTVIDYLRFHRAFKTDYEIECMREANRIGAQAHRAAEMAFRSGESEFGIQMAYLHASGLTQAELPYSNIVALNQHGAILHYSNFDREPAASADSFLIDAGASFNGYASDITRSYAAPDAEDFQALIDDMDAMQLDLCDGVRDRRSYAESAHQGPSRHRRDHCNHMGWSTCTPESAVESGLTSHFFPHGLGHGIGLQVHDIGGFMKGEDGGVIDKPDGHPYLRLTRDLARGMVVTIEPGLYFIDMLLQELRGKPEGKAVQWDKVDELRKYGGIRIEDDVACTDDTPLNLTREAFKALE